MWSQFSLDTLMSKGPCLSGQDVIKQIGQQIEKYLRKRLQAFKFYMGLWALSASEISGFIAC